MYPRLFAHLWENDDSDPTTFYQFTQPIVLGGIRWSLPGGVQAFEFGALAKDEAEAFHLYENSHGKRAVLYDHWIDRPPAAGHVLSVSYDGRLVRFRCSGAWKAHSRELDDTDYSAVEVDIDADLKTMLTAHVPYLSSDQSNIDSHAGTLGSEWSPNTGGQYPADTIREMLKWSDSNYATWDYWVRENTFNGGSLRQPLPYFKPRSDTADVDYHIALTDVVPGSLDQTRSIANFASSVKVIYGSSETVGTAATDATAAADYWTQEIAYTEAKQNATASDNYKNERLEFQKKPTLDQGFTIGSPWLYSPGRTTVWPLWDMFKRGRVYVRLVDFLPLSALLDSSRDDKQVFVVTAADYDYQSNTLRIVPEIPDTRLDAVLARSAGVPEAKSEVVGRYSRPWSKG